MHPTMPFLCQQSPGLVAQHFIPTSTVRLWDRAHNLGPSWKERKEDNFLALSYKWSLCTIPRHPESYITVFSVQTYQREIFLHKRSPSLVAEPDSIAWEASHPLVPASRTAETSQCLCHPTAQCHTALIAWHHCQRWGAVQLKIQVILFAHTKRSLDLGLNFLLS